MVHVGKYTVRPMDPMGPSSFVLTPSANKEVAPFKIRGMLVGIYQNNVSLDFEMESPTKILRSLVRLY